MKPTIHDVVIEKIVFGGAGLCRVDGKVCFVEDVLAGERVRIEIRSQHKKFSRGRLLEVLEPSPERVKPRCPHYGICGGCQYQCMTYAEELRVKEEQVRETFSHLGQGSGFKIHSIEASPSEYHYRMHATLHRIPVSDLLSRLGYYSRDNKTILTVKGCPILDKHLQTLFESDLALKKSNEHATLRNATCRANLIPPFCGGISPPSSRCWRDSGTARYPRGKPRGILLQSKDRISFWLTEKKEIASSQTSRFFSVQMMGKSIQTHSQGFFQNNPAVTEKIIRQIQHWVSELKPEKVADLFCGVGVFGLLAAANGKSLIFAEGNPKSVEALKINLAVFDQTSAAVLEGPVERVFPEYCKKEKSENIFLILDPPRTGLDPVFAKYLAGPGPTRGQAPFRGLAYLSCDLAVLVRDLRILLASGNLQIRGVVPFDMFPRTRHIETMVLLQPTA